MPDSGNQPAHDTDDAPHVRNSAPDWMRPEGVSRGVWEYVHSRQVASTFDAHIRDCPWATWDLAVARSLVEQVHNPLIVDFGCGTGRSIDVIGRDSTVHWIGIDLSLEMLRQARGRIEALPQRRNFLTVRANLTELGAIDSSRADIGLCLFSTLGMISDRANRKKFLQEVRRILKPGGIFILHAHNLWYALRFPRGLRWLTTSLYGAILGRGEFGDRTADFQDTRQLQLRHFRYSELKRTLRETGFQLQTAYRLADELERGYRPWHALATPGWLLVCRSV